MRFYFFRLCFLVLSATLGVGAVAQPKNLIGKVVNKTTGTPIGNGTIRNVNSGKALSPKSDGSFILEAGKGQILAFTANGYFTDTLTVTDSVLSLNGLRIGLRPLPSTLQSVTVTAGLNPYQRDSLARREEFLALVGKNSIPAISRANDLGFGVGINLDRFGKTEKRKRNARELFDVLEEDGTFVAKVLAGGGGGFGGHVRLRGEGRALGGSCVGRQPGRAFFGWGGGGRGIGACYAVAGAVRKRKKFAKI
jgi:hypothetical protein